MLQTVDEWGGWECAEMFLLLRGQDPRDICGTPRGGVHGTLEPLLFQHLHHLLRRLDCQVILHHLDLLTKRMNF